ncbi:forkhead box protein P1-B isoform X3 [Malaya genurostris]|uniref:forkhead box protein P1-B isoform X3 n=1 Tax=Malaya genurostris TaxID=325434 RepID=UPI0026F3D6F4|nr:forkhead box protein P1-B isoform X3 [Malaya genurostris]
MKLFFDINTKSRCKQLIIFFPAYVTRIFQILTELFSHTKTEESTLKLSIHPLFGGGACRWPGCERVFDEFNDFYQHLQSDHINGDYSAAQARIQMEVVCQLHLQLQKERDRLQAMILHLNKKNEMARIPMAGASPFIPQIPPPPPPYELIAGLRFPPPVTIAAGDAGMAEVAALQLTGKQQQALHHHQQQQHQHQQQQQASRSKGSGVRAKYFGSQEAAAEAGAFKEMNYPDVQDDVHKNREFYRSHDVRPPFTYASLIRQSIIESPEKQLTLNEIYNWFQNTFCYFRRNAATWKNAIRTNLSLHKCFVRYEDDFGSFWMVDDHEFLKRRHLSRGRPRKYDITMALEGDEPHSGAAPGSATSTATGTAAPTVGHGQNHPPTLGGTPPPLIGSHCYDGGGCPEDGLRSPKKEFLRR